MPAELIQLNHPYTKPLQILAPSEMSHVSQRVTRNDNGEAVHCSAVDYCQ